MFAGTGDANCEGTQVAMISPGSKLKVRRIRYWKNCATIEVALPDGGVGYIGFDSRNVSVTPSLP
jgi:hypothetical protein